MTGDNVEYLPIWKKGATAEEFLLEVAQVARKHPERFNRIAIVREELLPNGNYVTHYYCFNTTTIELLGLLDLGKDAVKSYTQSQT